MIPENEEGRQYRKNSKFLYARAPMKEKRATERLALPFKTEVINPRTNEVVTRTAKIQNMSRNGFSILTERPLKPHTPYLFRFHVNIFQSITVEGSVVRAQPDNLFHMSGAVVKPVSLGDRIQFNRFLIERISSLRRQFRFYAVGVGEILFLLSAMVLGIPMAVAAVVAIVATLVLMVWVPF